MSPKCLSVWHAQLKNVCCIDCRTCMCVCVERLTHTCVIVKWLVRICLSVLASLEFACMCRMLDTKMSICVERLTQKCVFVEWLRLTRICLSVWNASLEFVCLCVMLYPKMSVWVERFFVFLSVWRVEASPMYHLELTINN